MTDRTTEEAKREALIARCERDAHNLTFPFMAPTIKEQHEAAQTLKDCAAALKWQAEQQKGDDGRGLEACVTCGQPAASPHGVPPEPFWQVVAREAEEMSVPEEIVVSTFNSLLPSFLADKEAAGHITLPVESLFEEDSYGVFGSEFYRCRICHAESGAGVLNKGVPHESNCPLRDDARASLPQAPQGEQQAICGVYVASRASLPERPAQWRALRDAGWPIVSTWIDEAGEGETADLGELWERICAEVRASAGVVLHVEQGDFPLKGALIEIGMALGMGKRVGVYAPGVALENRSMRPLGSWAMHPLVAFRPTLEGALDWALSAPPPLAQGDSNATA